VSRRTRLLLVLAINLAMVAGLLVVGLLAHSLGVLAAGSDYLGDALGTGAAVIALRACGSEASRRRAGASAALANSSLLLLVTLLVAAEALRRLAEGAPAVHGVPVIVASVIAAAAMIACALILGDVEGDLPMESVMLDTVADAAAAIGVAASGAVILATGSAYWLDSAVALAIALAVGYHALRLTRRAAAHRRTAA
jgi:cobalt-zinc-cadmium efflux system protein